MPIQYVPTSTSIANLALQHLANKGIASLTENSENARSVSTYYDVTRDEVLREFNWPFARRFATLVLIGGTTTVPVNLDWQYSYRMPADCLKPRRILPGTRQDTEQTRWPFDVGGDATGGLIYTDFPVIDATTVAPQQPYLEYTVAATDESLWPSDFAQALSFKLAFYLAPQISQGGDSNKLGVRAAQLYEMTLGRAQANAQNAMVPDQPPESAFIRTR